MWSANTAPTMWPRSSPSAPWPPGAVRDVGRVLNMTYAEVDAIAKLIPSGPGALHITLEESLKLSKQLKDAYDENPQVKKLIDTAKAIEACPGTPPPTPPAWSSPAGR